MMRRQVGLGDTIGTTSSYVILGTSAQVQMGCVFVGKRRTLGSLKSAERIDTGVAACLLPGTYGLKKLRPGREILGTDSLSTCRGRQVLYSRGRQVLYSMGRA